MWPIVLEAFGALALFVFLMWWTMFSGRTKGELPDEALEDAAVNEAAAESSKDAGAPAATKRPEGAPGP
jgi:hypothetical protein